MVMWGRDLLDPTLSDPRVQSGFLKSDFRSFCVWLSVTGLEEPSGVPAEAQQQQGQLWSIHCCLESVHRESDTQSDHLHTRLSSVLIKCFLPYQSGGRGWLPLEAASSLPDFQTSSLCILFHPWGSGQNDKVTTHSQSQALAPHCSQGGQGPSCQQKPVSVNMQASICAVHVQLTG